MISVLQRCNQKSKSLKHGEKGQTMVEFSLVFLILIVMIVGFIETVIFVHTYNVLADSAKEGVRYAIVHGANSSAHTGPTCPCGPIDGAAGTGVVKTYAQYSLHDTSTMTVTVNYNPGSANGAAACNKPPCLVQVTVSYPYQPLFRIGWATVTVNAAAEGRIVF
jgi:Flp pilus assembly protein TadG